MRVVGGDPIRCVLFFNLTLWTLAFFTFGFSGTGHLNMHSFDCDVHRKRFCSQRAVNKHCGDGCVRVVRRRTTDDAEPVDLESGSWDTGASAEFADFVKKLVAHSGRKLRGLPNDAADWFCREWHLLAHFTLDTPFLQMLQYGKTSVGVLSLQHIIALTVSHVLWCKAMLKLVMFSLLCNVMFFVLNI